MTNVKQLDYVEKYFIQLGLKGKMKSVYDVYFAVFSPKYVGSADSAIIAHAGSQVYNANKALDLNSDGKLSVSDVKNWLAKYIPVSILETIPTTNPIPIFTILAAIYLLYRWKKNNTKNSTKKPLLLQD